MGNDTTSTRDRIVEIAYNEFLHHGYQATSLQTIADRLEITKPALYYHFRNKKDLYLHVVETYNARVIEQTTQINPTNLTTREQVLRLFQNQIATSFPGAAHGEDAAASDQYFFTVDAIHHFPELRERIVGTAGAFVDTMVEILTRGIETGEVDPDIDFQAITFHVGVMIEGLAAVSLLIDAIDEDVFNRYFELLWDRWIARNTNNEESS